MYSYLFRRLLQTIPVIFGVSIVAFLIIHLAPGDPVLMMLPQEATHSEIEEMRRSLGLDRPLIVQYFSWLQQVLSGDLGKSLFTSRPVLVEVLDRFPNTILLTVTAIFLAIVLGMPLGVLAAVKRGSSLDTGSMVASVVGWSMPNFWIGLMLIIVFGVWLKWLPTSGMYDLMAEEKTFLDLLRHLILPSFTLAVSHMAYVARFTRSSLLEVLNQDYIRTARAKGLHEQIVVLRHGLRNSLIPIISVLGVTVGHLLGGAVIVEAVFGWPGLGNLMIKGIFARDFPLVQGAMLFAAVTFIFVNVVADLLYAVVDPRIRYR